MAAGVWVAGCSQQSSTSEGASAGAAVQGGELVYLEQQAHTNLYPPAGGFYPNGGVLNQITDKLTYQDPKTLEIQPWIAESWTVNAEATEFSFKLRSGVSSRTDRRWTRPPWPNFDTYGLGNKALKLPVSEVINNYERSEVVDPLTEVLLQQALAGLSPGHFGDRLGPGLAGHAGSSFRGAWRCHAHHRFRPLRGGQRDPGQGAGAQGAPGLPLGPGQAAHQGRARLDEVKFIVTPEDSVRIGALLAGQAGFIRQVQAYDEKRVEQQKFQIYAPSTRGVNNSIAIRPDNALVADLKVRQALLHGTNTKEIVQTLFSPRYPQARSVIAKSAAGYVDLSAKLVFDEASRSACSTKPAGAWAPTACARRRPGLRALDLRIPAPAAEQGNPAAGGPAMGQAGHQAQCAGRRSGSRTVDTLDPDKTGCCRAWWAAPIPT
jgi:peptide/nickel transport system substrate-binding protein